MPMLSVEDLSINYGAIEAVKDVSFTVEEGEVVTLIGAMEQEKPLSYVQSLV
ncbi:branched-chain amino acid ABC transporter ATPase [Streptococcus pseudoporcinus]|uniref:Branched-chain amino acid ABC transporter ATPase n=1 Tax=Streptococcus pseudoporcinus TaxID=361101 RepID=A0A4U9ZCK1_9STRE|nr:branched-chain amino acid ABC transporter ATPase [Streptococcus pseudoporcinus]